MYNIQKIALLIVFLPTVGSANFITGIMHRMFGENFHTITEHEAYRSGTLSPRRLSEVLVRKKIKSIINLRGEAPSQKWWVQERAIANKRGVRLYNIKLPETTMPPREIIQELLCALREAPRPLLIHGKNGAHRTSLAAALYDFTQSGLSKHQAARQLSDSFGYFSTFNPAPRFFFDLLPHNKHQLDEWLTHYNHLDYPSYNKVSSPRMYPWMNFGVVEKHKLYRSAQLTPVELHKVIRDHKIKTVINLMGKQKHKLWWKFEHATARHAGAQVHDLKLFVDALPPQKTLARLLHLYDSASKPILIHCRDGADRTGEAAAIWRLHMQGASIREALKELSLRYCHFAPMHPAKRFFIQQWRGTRWALKEYSPYQFSAYHPPVTAGK